MSEAKILVTKPGAISLVDRDNLLLCGVVVVETETPEDVRFLSLETMPLGTNALLSAICDAVLVQDYNPVFASIGRRICQAAKNLPKDQPHD